MLNSSSSLMFLSSDKRCLLVSSTSNEYVLRPLAILRNLSRFGEFHLGMQCDAAEFFYGLMDSLQMCLLHGKKVFDDFVLFVSGN